MDLNNCDLAVANEGSFGPHPELLFAPLNHESVILIDKKNNIELVSDEYSMKTNFAASLVASWNELIKFSESVKFPSHAIILRRSKDTNTDIYKGITSKEELKSTFNFLYSKYGAVYAETDMRAMFNPTRMLVIEQAFKKILKKVHSKCPNCSTIGFDASEVITGLPCSLCGLKTKSILSHVYKCYTCSYTEEKKYPNAVKEEDPMYCDFCNP